MFANRKYAAPSAGHHPPAHYRDSSKFSIKAALLAVRCMPLLDAADV